MIIGSTIKIYNVAATVAFTEIRMALSLIAEVTYKLKYFRYINKNNMQYLKILIVLMCFAAVGNIAFAQTWN